MTAEVAILNKDSVALAADSAVTTGDQKIFNTVNKLFALSKHQPVGIMAYSAAQVMGVPVETVIKEFRRLRGPAKCKHLGDYADAFEEFLRKDKSVFSNAGRIRPLADSACGLVETLRDNALDNLLQKLKQGWGHPTEDEAKAAFEEALSKLEKRVEDSPALKIRNRDKKAQQIANAISGELTDAIDWLKDSLTVDVDAESRIRKLVIEHFFHEEEFGSETGFVIAGFGTDDVFPCLKAFQFRYSVFGLHRVKHKPEVIISEKNTAQIAPFGQVDVMATFVEGIDPKHRLIFRHAVDEHCEEMKARLLKETPPKTSEAQQLDEFREGLLQHIPDKLERMTYEYFVSPTIDVVATMPKEELALLAEALVNLTAVKRKWSKDKETVGGPTDVAVISKGDGFIWIKRKHYFDPKLNPGYLARNMEEGI